MGYKNTDLITAQLKSVTYITHLESIEHHRLLTITVNSMYPIISTQVCTSEEPYTVARH